jgi:hypothetical protein
LILVQPETVVRWHKAGFKSYWTWPSLHRNCVGRKCVSHEVRDLKQDHSYAKTRRFASSLRLGRLSCYSEDFAPDLKKDRGRSAPNNLYRPLSNPFVPAYGHSPTAPPSDKPFRYNRSVQNPVLIPSG